MDVKSFSNWARAGGDPLRADDLVIRTPGGEYRGYGTIRIVAERFLLTVTIRGDNQLPWAHGHVSHEDFWKISGVLEDRLPFNAAGLAHRQTSHSGRVSVLQAEFRLGRLSFVSEATAAAENEMHRQLERIRGATPEMNSEAEQPRANLAREYFAYALLPGHTLLWANAGTKIETLNDFLGQSESSSLDTFMGELNGFSYALVKAGNDCEFHLRTSAGFCLASDNEFRTAFDAFLAAIAFLHGREAWPQHRRLTRDYETLEEDITPWRAVPRTSLVLLNDGACARGANFGNALECAVKFFLSSASSVSGIKRYLYLCRQSSLSRTPLDVGTLSLCSVFEGVVALLYHHCAPLSAEDGEEAFQQAKHELLALAKEREEQGIQGFGRLVGILSSAKPLRPEDRFRHIVARFGLPKEKMELVLAAWKSERHALAHGGEPSDKSDRRTFRQSRLAGGINLLVAKMMGYEGLAIFSVLEDHYIRI